MITLSDIEINIINARKTAKLNDRYFDSKGNVLFGTQFGTLIIPPVEMQGLISTEKTKDFPPGTMIPVDFIATQAIKKYQVVTSKGEVADSNNIQQRDKIIGIAIENVSSGFAGRALQSGRISNPSWSMIKGTIVFLNGSSLSMQNPTSGYSLIIGSAVAPDTINVNLGVSIRL